MHTLIQEFTLLSLKYYKNDVIDLYNYFLSTLSKEQVVMIKDYFPVFIRCAETAREAEKPIQDLIKKEGYKKQKFSHIYYVKWKESGVYGQFDQ